MDGGEGGERRRTIIVAQRRDRRALLAPRVARREWPWLAARAAARRAGRRRHSRRFSSTPGALRAHDAPPRRRSSSFTSAGVQLNLALQPRPRCFALCLLPARHLGSRRTITRRSRASRWSRRPGSMVKVRPPPQAHAERAERAEGAEHPCHSGAEERLAVAPLPIRPPLATQALREWQSAVQHHRLRRLRLGLR